MRKFRRARPRLEKIHQSLREHFPELRVRYRVRSLGLFGSYVRGEQGLGSDLDVLVMKSALKPRIGERILSELEPV